MKGKVSATGQFLITNFFQTCRNCSAFSLFTLHRPQTLAQKVVWILYLLKSVYSESAPKSEKITHRFDVYLNSRHQISMGDFVALSKNLDFTQLNLAYLIIWCRLHIHYLVKHLQTILMCQPFSGIFWCTRFITSYAQ